MKLKDNKKKNSVNKSSTTNYYKVSNNSKKIDNYFKSTSQNAHFTAKKTHILTSTNARDSKQKYTKGKDSSNKVSILQNRKSHNLSTEEVLKVKFYFNNQFKLLVPISRENQASRIWFEDYGNINNMHLIDPPGDGDCFFHIICFLAKLNGWYDIPCDPIELRYIV